MKGRVKRLTGEEFTILKPYEQNFRTAIFAKCSSPIPLRVLKTMKEILTRIDGTDIKVNYNCSSCVLTHLLQPLGHKYFDALEEVKPERRTNTSSDLLQQFNAEDIKRRKK